MGDILGYIGIMEKWKLELLQHVGIIWGVRKAAALDVHRCMFPESRPFRLLRPRPRYSGIRGSRSLAPGLKLTGCDAWPLK